VIPISYIVAEDWAVCETEGFARLRGAPPSAVEAIRFR